uniref:Serine-threonine/tyrosine-protein kinase catalytic domain-containing protein n=1 Tax=Anopheles melas TaxID=34690 RepID=A0A182U9P7_9DIPT
MGLSNIINFGRASACRLGPAASCAGGSTRRSASSCSSLSCSRRSFRRYSENSDLREIIKLVRDGPGILDAPFRPKVDESSYEDVNNIMIKCWSEEPTDRPDFSGLKTIIRKINNAIQNGRQEHARRTIINLANRIELNHGKAGDFRTEIEEANQQKR